MRPVILILFSQILFFNISIYFNNGNIDSLRRDSATTHYNKKIAELDNDSLKIMELQYEQGLFWDKEGEFDIATELFEQALTIAIS